MRPIFAIVLITLISVALTNPAHADTVTVSIDFESFPVGVVPDTLNPYSAIMTIHTSAWNTTGNGASVGDSIDVHPDLVFFQEQGIIAEVNGSRLIQVTKGRPHYEDWIGIPVFEFDEPWVRVDIEGRFLVPVLDFSVDVWSDDFTFVFFYDGYAHDTTRFQSEIHLNEYTWHHLSIQAPAGGRITGFRFGQWDTAEPLRVMMDNLTVTAQLPESDSSTIFLAFGLSAFGLFLRRP